ncbi:hypothetical protein, partial [Mycobacterium sp.]|uniref:hypothetical protein n=1 Tax=Mycobacterium sp. TaxID=1785 RepID=UPI0031D1D5C7
SSVEEERITNEFKEFIQPKSFIDVIEEAINNGIKKDLKDVSLLLNSGKIISAKDVINDYRINKLRNGETQEGISTLLKIYKVKEYINSRYDNLITKAINDKILTNKEERKVFKIEDNE